MHWKKSIILTKAITVQSIKKRISARATNLASILLQNLSYRLFRFGWMNLSPRWMRQQYFQLIRHPWIMIHFSMSGYRIIWIDILLSINNFCNLKWTVRNWFISYNIISFLLNKRWDCAKNVQRCSGTRLFYIWPLSWNSECGNEGHSRIWTLIYYRPLIGITWVVIDIDWWMLYELCLQICF